MCNYKNLYFYIIIIYILIIYYLYNINYYDKNITLVPIGCY